MKLFFFSCFAWELWQRVYTETFTGSFETTPHVCFVKDCFNIFHMHTRTCRWYNFFRYFIFRKSYIKCCISIFTTVFWLLYTYTDICMYVLSETSNILLQFTTKWKNEYIKLVRTREICSLKLLNGFWNGFWISFCKSFIWRKQNLLIRKPTFLNKFKIAGASQIHSIISILGKLFYIALLFVFATSKRRNQQWNNVANPIECLI